MLSKTLRTINKNGLQRQMMLGSQRSFANDISNEPAKRVAVTGAAGNIAYSILFRLASGEFLGKK